MSKNRDAVAKWRAENPERARTQNAQHKATYVARLKNRRDRLAELARGGDTT